MSIFHFCMCNLKKNFIYIIYIYIYIYKRVLRVLFPGVTVPVLDTRISVSFLSRVHLSRDLATHIHTHISFCNFGNGISNLDRSLMVLLTYRTVLVSFIISHDGNITCRI
jgi:hypothetical protein